MEILIITIAILGFIAVQGLILNKRREALRKEKIKMSWGTVSEQIYTDEKMDFLKYYYEHKTKSEGDIDDITWNDLNMDEIYMLLNQTFSSVGEEYLYQMMRKPVQEEEELKERDRVMNAFTDSEEKRIEFQAIFDRMGKFTRVSVYEYLNRLDDIETDSSMKHRLMAASFVISLGIIFIEPAIGIILSFGTLFNNLVQYSRRKAKIEPYINVFSYITRLLSGIDEMRKIGYEPLQGYVDELTEVSSQMKKFSRLAVLIKGGNSMTGNLMDILMDYERMIFHTDLIQFNKMLILARTQKKELFQLYERIGYLDSLASVASFRQMVSFYCTPELEQTKTPFVEVKDMYHPVVDEPVLNSIQAHRPVLITGSNASGKSTFIKTLAINAILSQTIYTSLSRSYHASFFRIYSSMALRDDIRSKESYYIVEIKSLKRILDHMHGEIPILCFVDEVLRGTNTLERIAASSQILKIFAEHKTLCFAATHDIELTHMLEAYYDNYHFQEQVKENEVVFDYILYEGRAFSKNAIKLLRMIGYPEQVIEQANLEVEDFLQQGTWNLR